MTTDDCHLPTNIKQYWRCMSTVYYILEIAICAIIIMCIGFYIAYIIDSHHKNLNRFQIASAYIIEDLTIIAEQIEEHNRLLKKIIDKKRDKNDSY